MNNLFRSLGRALWSDSSPIESASEGIKEALGALVRAGLPSGAKHRPQWLPSPIESLFAQELTRELQSFRPTAEFPLPSAITFNPAHDYAALNPEGVRVIITSGVRGYPGERAIALHTSERVESKVKVDHLRILGYGPEVDEATKFVSDNWRGNLYSTLDPRLSSVRYPRHSAVASIDAFLSPIEDRMQDSLRAVVQYLINEQSSFVPTREVVFPQHSRLPGAHRNGIVEVAAVLAGTKPAALATAPVFHCSTVARQLLREAHETGFASYWPKGTPQEMIIGSVDAVEEYRALKHAYNRCEEGPRVNQRPFDAHYHRTIGRLLGYPKASIEEFVRGI